MLLLRRRAQVTLRLFQRDPCHLGRPFGGPCLTSVGWRRLPKSIGGINDFVKRLLRWFSLCRYVVAGRDGPRPFGLAWGSRDQAQSAAVRQLVRRPHRGLYCREQQWIVRNGARGDRRQRVRAAALRRAVLAQIGRQLGCRVKLGNQLATRCLKVADPLRGARRALAGAVVGLIRLRRGTCGGETVERVRTFDVCVLVIPVRAVVGALRIFQVQDERGLLHAHVQTAERAPLLV